MKIVKLNICLSDDKFQYIAYAIADRLRYYYLEDSTYIEITFREFLTVIHNPYLYYFSTALRLHTKVLNKNNPNWFRETHKYVKFLSVNYTTMKTNSKWFWQKFYSYFSKPKKLSHQEEIERLIKETNDILKAEGKFWERTPEEKSQMQVVFFPSKPHIKK